MRYSVKEINSAYFAALKNQESPLFSELLEHFFDCMYSYMNTCAQSVTPSAAVQDDIIAMYKGRISRYMKNYCSDRGTPFKYCCSIINSVNKRFIENFKRTDKRVDREEKYCATAKELRSIKRSDFAEDIILLCEESLTECKMDAIMRSKTPENIYIKPEIKDYLQSQIRGFYASE